jgi:hypothetical protein
MNALDCSLVRDIEHPASYPFPRRPASRHGGRDISVTEVLLDDLVLEKRRGVAVQLALDHKKWAWLAGYLSGPLPFHLQERFGVVRPDDATMIAAVRRARFLRHALDDRQYLVREVHRSLSEILPEAMEPVRLIFRGRVPSFLRHIERLARIKPRTHDSADERTMQCLQKATSGFSEAFRSDCELLLAGKTFRELGRLRGLPEASYATVWRRRWLLELAALRAALTTQA